MPYPAPPARRMPWDNDGSVLALGSLEGGVIAYPTGAQAIYCNGLNTVASAYITSGPTWDLTNATPCVWLFFPELREVAAYYLMMTGIQVNQPNVWGWNAADLPVTIKGSTNTTNGLDGTWTTAALGGQPTWVSTMSWRSQIQSISITGGQKAIRFEFQPPGVGTLSHCYLPQLHVYGAKYTGQTPDDILYLDGNNAYAEFTAPEDFGDMPLGTTATRTVKVQNSSATKTANSVNLQCNDADFVISQDGTTWVTSFTLASLAAGASSGVLYVRDTAPNAGAVLGPRFARIVATVGSWT